MDICAGDSEAGGDPSTGTDGVETKEVANFYATPSNKYHIRQQQLRPILQYRVEE